MPSIGRPDLSMVFTMAGRMEVLRVDSTSQGQAPMQSSARYLALRISALADCPCRAVGKRGLPTLAEVRQGPS